MKCKIGNITLDILPPVKRYMNAIERRLRVDRKTKLRIMTELAGDFQSRRDNGQSDEAIMKELGTPEQVAAEFNASLGGAPSVSRWRWGFVVLAAVVLAVVLVPAAVNRLAVSQPDTIGVIGGADGPTSIYVTTSPFQSLVGILPWLLGCAAAFLLPVWRTPHTDKGYGPSLLLSGLGIFPLCLVAAELVVVACTTELPAAQLGAACWALLSGFFLNGEWLCAAVLVWGFLARRRGQKQQKKTS